MKKRILLAVVLPILIANLTGCRIADQPTQALQTETAAEATSEAHDAGFTVIIGEATTEETSAAVPSAAEEETAAPDPTAGCPVPSEGSKLYVDEKNGFCLLYPQNLKQSTYKEFRFDRVQFVEPASSAGPSETVVVSLVIESNGPAKELTSSQYARKWVENFAIGAEPSMQDFMVNGYEGVLMGLETEMGPKTQNIFLAANETKYRITLSPMPGTAPQLESSLQAVWKMVITSLVFFPPQMEQPSIAPEDVCPQETSGYKQYISLTDGYCLLYPSDFEPAEDFPGEFIGGPVLEENTSWGDLRASLTVGTAGNFSGQTIMDVLDTRREYIDTDSIQETTIAGCPAVVFRDPRGPWSSRQAMIMRDGFVYTLVNQPWEPERYPDGMVYLDGIWETVTGSLTFFDPWR